MKILLCTEKKAEFVEHNKVKVGDEVIEADKIFINTGQKTVIPNIKGLENINYLDSTSIMDLSELPKHLIIIGGGYIGMEFGQMFRRYGSEVTVIHRRDQLLPREDKDIADTLKSILEDEGIKIILNANPKEIKKSDEGISVVVERDNKEEEFKGTHILIATGRKSNTETLGLDKAGVEVDEKGNVKVNDKLETNVEGIWALGDVKGGPAFTHISYNDYEIVYGNLIEGKNLSTKDRYLVYAVFTDPSLGRVGITENEAKEKGLNYNVAEMDMSSVARAVEMDETKGKMKVESFHHRHLIRIPIYKKNHLTLGTKQLLQSLRVFQTFSLDSFALHPFSFLPFAQDSFPFCQK